MQHILFPPLKKRCSTETRKNELFFLECFVGTVFFFLYLYAKTWKPICSYTWVCVNNGLWCKCLLLFFFSMLLCLSVKEKRTWSVKLIRISIFLLNSAFVNKIIWVFLKLCRNTLLSFCDTFGVLWLKFDSVPQLTTGVLIQTLSWSQSYRSFVMMCNFSCQTLEFPLWAQPQP